MKGTVKEKPSDRTEEIYGLLCTGLRRAQILDYAAKQNWEEGEAAIDELIARATGRLAEAATISLDEETGRALERLNKLFQAAMRVQDYKTALSVQKEINRVLKIQATDGKVAGRRQMGKLRIVK